ncbi:MAG TPA: hypothetical protein DCP38_12180, partial [Acidobacteria bacterium]|nr:hypothetical protein [Acidobacteriota bacterium]
PALVRLTAAAAVTLVIATAMLWPYRQVRVQEDFRRPLRIVEMYAASPWSYLSTTARLHYRTWSHRVFGERTTEALFPGFVALALSGVALGVRRRTQTAGRRRMLVAIAAVGFVLSLGTMTPLYAWVYHVVPPMQGIRAAARFGYLVLFAVAALAFSASVSRSIRVSSAESPRRSTRGSLTMIAAGCATSPARTFTTSNTSRRRRSRPPESSIAHCSTRSR